MEFFRILSIDGGGIRGVLAVKILQRLEIACPGFLNHTDLFAGTSTGAIIALGLANGMQTAEVLQLYQQTGGEIFRSGLLRRLTSLWGIIGAKYSTANRFAALYPSFGDTTLRQLHKKVLITSFRVARGRDCSGTATRWKSKLFHNFPGADSDGNERAIDVVMRSTAAPTFFPVFQGYVDGAVVANNPSMCALAQAIHPQTGGQTLENVMLLSISCGNKPQYVSCKNADWGLKQWGFKIIDLLLEAGPGLADFQCKQLLGARYLRIDISLPQVIGIDDVAKTDQLMKLADHADLSSAISWIRTIWLR